MLYPGDNIEKRHDERGIPVIATITEINQGFRNAVDYECTYYNEEGELVEAYLTLNKSEAAVGDKVEGTYLPEAPNHVYCKADFRIKLGVISIGLIGAIYWTVRIFYYKKYGRFPLEEE